ncbi:sugar transferase [Arthrobacter sp. ISL-28]|uniref:sugar transferase n=1 Tax=Arthrobacter sp. ISL-28 TaxID=2819108 RepID=UPI001BECE7A1|nr:sugar transferase [Arthrobacter sp. ISL-28]MBT2519664.1 sugar transferase [Arthrobacter sp. ISL-28]
MVEEGANEWRSRYARRLAVVDGCIVVWATAGALLLRFGSPEGDALISGPGQPYMLLSLALAAAWWSMLSLWGSRDTKILGYGVEEYKRVVTASLWLFGIVAILSYSFQFDTARGYVGLAFPVGVLSLVICRYLVRKLLHVERLTGKSASRVLILGDAESVKHLTQTLLSQPTAGYLPVAAYLPGFQVDDKVPEGLGLPVLGNDPSLDAILEAIAACEPDAVALSSGIHLPPGTIRALGWAVADLNLRMIMAPALTDVAGPRIHTQPVAGLPLIHVSTPNLEAGQRLLKRTFDLVAGTTLILILSPLLVVLAVLVKLDSEGPVLFRQERIGTCGEPFRMLKFRSMVVDAEHQLELLRSRNEGNTVLFKLKEDPRVTRLGRFIRRYSLDELPQLFNVVGGSMSLVGPRPPLASEVALYEAHVHRRLLVRPGLTGLWQVSGRSLLTWEEAVRLDLFYVENWSLLVDISILFQTFRAVISRHGAY